MPKVALLALAALLVSGVSNPVVSPARAANPNDWIHEVCAQSDNPWCIGLLSTNSRQWSTESEMGQWAMFCMYLEGEGLLGSPGYPFDDIVECHQAYREGTRGPDDNGEF